MDIRISNSNELTTHKGIDYFLSYDLLHGGQGYMLRRDYYSSEEFDKAFME